MKQIAINPANGTKIKEYAETTPDQVAGILDRVDRAQQLWQAFDIEERAGLMLEAGEILERDAEHFANLMALEMGKPIREGVSEAKKCAWVCRYYAEHAADFLSPEQISTDAAESYVTFRPLGVILAVMPWNFPFWQVFRFAAPTLVAGNCAVLKHASNVPGCALAIEEIFHKAGFPQHIFHTLLISSRRVSEVIAHPAVRGISLTGSTPAGRSVAAQAGKHLKKTVLELGGSDPYVVLADADIKQAAKACVTGRMINTGQSCIAAKRFIVVPEVLDDFRDCVLKKMREFEPGDPLDPETKIGPLAREDLRNELHRQVTDSVTAGAKLLLGGRVPEKPGAWYEPTLLGNVKPGMPAYDEELFGPVGVIIEAADEADALRIAADTPFGLGAAVFTRDIERGRKIAEKHLKAGCCFVNDFVRSDPRLPFGGIRDSGWGRELSRNGILEFVNSKTVYVK